MWSYFTVNDGFGPLNENLNGLFFLFLFFSLKALMSTYVNIICYIYLCF